MKTERKLMVIGLVCLLVSIAFGSAFAVTRTITSTGDSFDTFIRNSKGNYWDATTQSNLQAAISDLSTTGGTVWVSPCNISITGTSLSIVNNTHLIGAGKDSILFKADDANIAIMSIHGQSNSIIEGLMFNCNNIDQSAYTGAIDFTQASWSRNVTIRDCFFYRSNKSFIDCQERTAYITIENNYFDNIATSAYWPGAVWLSGSYCTIKNNIIKDTYANGIVVESSTPTFPASWGHVIDGNIIYGRISVGINMENYKSKNCTIINNQIFNLNSSAYAGNPYSTAIGPGNDSICSNNVIFNVETGIGITNSESVVISNNILRNIQKYGIDIYSVTAYLRSSRTIITGNALYTMKYGIRYEGNVLISNNFINKTTSHAIYDVYAGTKPIYAEITGNTIRFAGGAGIRGAKYDIITNNIITNSSGHGIWDGRIISDNVIQYNTWDGINIAINDAIIDGNMIENNGLHGVHVSAAMMNFSITNNYIHGHTVSGYGGINITGTTSRNFVISNNRIINNHEYSCRVPNGNINFIITGNIFRIVGSGHQTLDERSANADLTQNMTANNLE